MARLFPALLLASSLAACDEHGGANAVVNLPPDDPEVVLLGALEGDPGLLIEISFVARDPDSVATSDVTAVPRFAGASELAVAQGIPEQDGLVHTLQWDTSGVPEGLWSIEVRTSDGEHTSVGAADEIVVLGPPVSEFPRVVTDALGAFYPSALAAGRDGGALVAGSYGGDIGLAVGTPAERFLTAGSGSMELALLRYAPDGTLAWAVQTEGLELRGGPSESGVIAHRIRELPDSSTLGAGAFFGIVGFGPGEPGEALLTFEPSGVSERLGFFLARWNQDGTLAWARQGSGVSGASGPEVAALPGGSLAVCGFAQDAAQADFVFGPEDQPEGTLDSASSAGGFLATWTAAGAFQQALGVPMPVSKASGSGQPLAMTVNAAGDMFVTGWYQGTVQFTDDGTTRTSSPHLNNYDLFVARYRDLDGDGDGTWLNAPRAQEQGFILPLGLAATPEGGCVVAGARWEGTLTFDPDLPSEVALGPADLYGELFLARLAGDGTTLWARDTGIHDPAWLVPSLTKVHDVQVLPDGSLVLATVVERDAPGETIVLAAGGPDAIALVLEGEEALVLSRWSPDGTLLWALSDGGPDPSPRGVNLVRRVGGGLHLLGANAEVLGAFTADEVTLPGEHAFFLARYGEDGSF